MYLASCDVDIEGAMLYAGGTADPDGLGALACALIGASTGATPWMEAQFAKRENAWQIEMVVRDLFIVGVTCDEPLEELVARYPVW